MHCERPDPSHGVFETLLVRDGRVHAHDAHLQRLASSVAELYGLTLPAGLPSSIARRAAALAGTHRLRLDASLDRGRLHIEQRTSPLDAGDPSPVVLAPVQVAGGVGRHKWSDRRLLDCLGGPPDVPLLVDRDGSVLEAAWANVWLIEGETLITPPADGRLLPGVTRALLLELADREGLEVGVEPISLERVRSASAIFLTSALRLAVPATLHTPAWRGAGAPEPPAVASIRTMLSGACWT